MTRYIGNKKDIVEHILRVIYEQTEGVRSALDVFAGTGTVAMRLKERGIRVKANDSLYYSYVLNKAQLEMNEPLSQDMLKRIEFLNSDDVLGIPPCGLDGTFVRDNYSLYEGCERMYFTPENALRIDRVRGWIEYMRMELSEAEYYYLLKLLLDAVSRVANTSGTFGAPLKKLDKRALNRLELVPTDIIGGDDACQAYNMDAIEFANSVSADIAYLDPPYCSRQYIDYYHLLETIARYDCPEIHGKCGYRNDPEKRSDFCSTRKARAVFERLLSALDVHYIVLSYSDDKNSILSKEELAEIVCKYGKPETFRLIEIPYRRYKGKRGGEKNTVNELIYFIQK